ncbi:MAG: 30S ribosomal protein S9 [bacterium]|nr:30S ribosomal protein S9 [bacterium]
MPTATKEKKETKEKALGRFIETVGRRKTATARARIFSDDKQKKGVDIVINEKAAKDYFHRDDLRKTVFEPLEKLKITAGYYITVKVKGGGIRGQAEAVRHAIARALVKEDEGVRKKLKRPGFLKRDPRMKERRKFGLKKARKAPQWSKR